MDRVLQEVSGFMNRERISKFGLFALVNPSITHILIRIVSVFDLHRLQRYVDLIPKGVPLS